VPPQHLLCHVHSAGRRRPGHPTGGVPVYSIGRPYAYAMAYTAPIVTRARHINTIGATEMMVLGDLLGDTSIGYFCMYSLCFAPGPTYRGPAPLYVPPLSYKREGTRRYKGDTLRPNSGSQVHTRSQAQYITQWSRVLRSGGPNHSKSLCVLMFSPFPPSRQNT
jgi:hypothetical protein